MPWCIDVQILILRLVTTRCFDIVPIELAAQKQAGRKLADYPIDVFDVVVMRVRNDQLREIPAVDRRNATQFILPNVFDRGERFAATTVNQESTTSGRFQKSAEPVTYIKQNYTHKHFLLARERERPAGYRFRFNASDLP